ncbi:MAG: hypothetical protein ACYC1Y_02230 [Minisyncoccota bacterium]
MADNMRHFLLTSFVALALFVGFGTHVPVAHATTCSDSTGAWGTWDPAANNGKGACVVTSLSPAQQLAAQNSPTDSTTNANTSDKGYNSVMIWIMGLFAWLLGVAALTLDYAVYYTVISMGTFVHNLTAVGVTWRILRDIGNILLIFGFLAIGISIILNTERLGYGKKMLPMLLLAAVFLNFSLFFSEAVVDVSNLFATQFYTQINGGQQPTAVSLQSLSVANEGISNKIMAQLGLQTIYGNATNPAKAQELFSNASPTFVGFMGIILFMVTAFVMFSLAFILIARFITLLFLIIVAPVGFAGLAVPKLDSIAKKWWGALFDQALTAPALLLLLYIALSIITDVNFLKGFGATSTGADAATGFVGNANLPGFASFMISFLVAMGLLFAVVIFAKKLGAAGAAGATKLASKLSGASLVAGGIGFAGRYTVGAGGNYAAKKLRRTEFGRSFVGRGIAGTLDKKVAGASFDVRNTALGKTISGYGLDMGKGQKGGYKADLEARVKSYEAAAAGITGRAQTKEEKEVLAAAEKKRAEAESGHTAIKNHHEVATQRVKERKAEIARLEEEKSKGGKYWEASNPEQAKKLEAARQDLAVGETTLAEADKKLAQAEKDEAAAIAEHAMKKSEIEAATSAKRVQQEYAERLEKVWGNKIPFLGTAAAAAAPRIKNSIGKTKEQKELEALLAKIKKAGESGEGGGEKEEKK